jgi:hypothetical protein
MHDAKWWATKPVWVWTAAGALMLCALVGTVSCAGGAGRAGGSGAAQAAPALELPGEHDTAPRDYAGIHNAVMYGPGLISGSQPEGEQGLDTLRALGIKTIISVDGAVPQVAQAESRGMRYIHLPIGYNGISDERRLQLTRATRDALRDGPVYLHCHHGKHRSAGAAAAVAAGLSRLTPEQGVERMKVSRTAAGYKGLWAAAATARPVESAALDAVDSASLVSVARPSDFVESMVQVDEVMEHLQAIEKAGWRTPGDHPDLVPAAEAARAVELLRAMAEGSRPRSHAPDFLAMLRDGQAHAQRLEDALAKGSADAAALSGHLKLLAASCKDCHVMYRD